VVDPSGIYRFTYGIYGNLVKEEKIVKGRSYLIEYNYDKSGHVTGITYPDGLVVHYDRDGMGKAAGVNVIRDGNSQLIASGISYLPFGPMKGLNFGNGISMVKTFDQAYRVTSIKAGSVEDLSYSYDVLSNIASIQNNTDSAPHQSFSYDNLDRLIHAEGIYGTIAYTYDPVGNRLSKAIDGSTDTYSYFTGTNKISQITGSDPKTFSYDNNGNTTSMGDRSFTYNQNNRLIKSSENGSTLGEYTYNAFGQRIVKTAGGKTTIFHYDQLGNIISEETPGNELVRDYIYIDHTRIAMVVSTKCLADIGRDHDVDGLDLAILAADFNRTDCSDASPCDGDINGDRAVNLDDLELFSSDFGRDDCPNDEFYYFHNDHLGTPKRITDDSGTVVWSANYKPFGEATIIVNTIPNSFRFPGQYHDQETGLHYNYHRYYDPRTGRYLRPDPIGLAVGCTAPL
jgi:RHS repeat-associated protein